GFARNFGTRNRLALTNVVQYDLPIDIADCIKARGLGFPEIKSSQGLKAPVGKESLFIRGYCPRMLFAGAFTLNDGYGFINCWDVECFQATICPLNFQLIYPGRSAQTEMQSQVVLCTINRPP